ncbi:glycosyltransferase 87 family protein [Micromonospora sp. NBC_01796]|uniref:glycosyltransferase 87 family protein n=1 Tax=Micromonospora sp. NBC_01796 TaxID=2975987 RepID=UPI002DD8ED67|nr:glycosyltransferase 87 family protein [Micromonospora sp. NBC_01796]WSA86999.1 glycosyltransferase 87 family protein [Micromonospora sp. NBC_01796]
MAQGTFRRTRYQVLFVLALAVLVAAFLSVAAVGHGFFDLKVYSGALHYWAREGGEIYDWLKPNSKYGFTYPPFAALVMLPLAYLPFTVSMVLSVSATVVVSVLLLWWLVDPIARRVGWTRWFALAVAALLAAAFEPMRETVDFGQVNMLLLVLVAADLLWLVRPGYAAPGQVVPGSFLPGRAPAGGLRTPSRYKRWAGVGIGLATAIKLTPGIFIVYLLVTGRWRAALTASGTAAVATLVAAAIAPDASREFWTTALWDTDRVGELAFISNQSLQGMVARLDPAQPSKLAWLILVGAAVVIWAWRVRAAVRIGDEVTGLALTGVLGALVSPVTWVHHLVWLIPALVLLVDHAYGSPAGSRRRRWLLAFAIVAYAVLCSRLVWPWEHDFTGVGGFLGSNAYVWVSIALLVGLPIGAPSRLAEPGGVPKLDQPERRPSPGPV